MRFSTAAYVEAWEENRCNKTRGITSNSIGRATHAAQLQAVLPLVTQLRLNLEFDRGSHHFLRTPIDWFKKSLTPLERRDASHGLSHS